MSIGVESMGRLFYYLRHALGLTLDEASALSTLLARYNDYLNYRWVKGFRVLVNSNKKCEYYVKINRRVVYIKCGRRADVAVVMVKGDKHFSIYLCGKHFKKFIGNAVKKFTERMDRLYRKVANAIYSNNMFSDIDLDGIEVVLGETDKD